MKKKSKILLYIIMMVLLLAVLAGLVFARGMAVQKAPVPPSSPGADVAAPVPSSLPGSDVAVSVQPLPQQTQAPKPDNMDDPVIIPEKSSVGGGSKTTYVPAGESNSGLLPMYDWSTDGSGGGSSGGSSAYTYAPGINDTPIIPDTDD